MTEEATPNYQGMPLDENLNPVDPAGPIPPPPPPSSLTPNGAEHVLTDEGPDQGFALPDLSGEYTGIEVEIETFTAGDVKRMALLLTKVLDDPQVQQVMQWMIGKEGDAITQNIIPIAGAFVRAGLSQAANELDEVLAGLLKVEAKEFLAMPGEVYPKTIETLVAHPGFVNFLKAGKGMAGVISKRWSTHFNSGTAGLTSTSKD